MTLKIRLADKDDGPALGKMGAALAQLHHGWDEKRFMLVEGVEEGYRRWLLRETQNPNAVVLVAERDGKPVGYAYGTINGRNWNMLLDDHGAIEDLYVDGDARKVGVGAALAEAMIGRLKEKGVPRVVLYVAKWNDAARALFVKLGWRESMVELTRDL